MYPTINCDNCGKSLRLEDLIVTEHRKRKLGKKDEYIYGMEQIKSGDYLSKKLGLSLCCCNTLLCRRDYTSKIYGFPAVFKEDINS